MGTKTGICNGAEPGGGMTLADCAELAEGTEKIMGFKRPKHGLAYAFGIHSQHLMEFNAGKTYLPRLTAEDLTACDWQEVEL